MAKTEVELRDARDYEACLIRFTALFKVGQEFGLNAHEELLEASNRNKMAK